MLSGRLPYIPGFLKNCTHWTRQEQEKRPFQHSSHFLFIEQLGHKWWSNFLSNLNSVPERVFFSKGRYLHAVRGVAEQASEGDGVGDRAQVDEEDGGEGLDVQPVVEVAGEERQLALDVQDEAAAEPGGGAPS